MNTNQGAARRQVSDVVAERIERLIVDGVLKVGQPLPSERRLCEKLGISRSALREGLKVLRGRGIIDTAQGRDSRVAKLSGERDASPLQIGVAPAAGSHQHDTQQLAVFLHEALEARSGFTGEARRGGPCHQRRGCGEWQAGKRALCHGKGEAVGVGTGRANGDIHGWTFSCYENGFGGVWPADSRQIVRRTVSGKAVRPIYRKRAGSHDCGAGEAMR